MLDKLPRVSIIVLNWNGRAHLADCFDSLLGLDYPHELVTLMLVDNGSTDDSVAYMREHYPQVTLVVNDHNLGFAGGNNTGARAATTDYIAFLNNDAHVYPDWLSKLIEAIQSDPEVICVGARLMDISGERVEFGGSSINFYGYGYQEGYNRSNVSQYEGTHPTIFACGGSLLIRRDVFLAVGGFD